MVSGKHWVHSAAAAGVTLVDCDVDLIDGKRLGAIQLNFIVWLAYQLMLPGQICPGPVSRKYRQLFRLEKPVVKLQSVCFEKLILCT